MPFPGARPEGAARQVRDGCVGYAMGVLGEFAQKAWLRNVRVPRLPAPKSSVASSRRAWGRAMGARAPARCHSGAGPQVLKDQDHESTRATEARISGQKTS